MTRAALLLVALLTGCDEVIRCRDSIETMPTSSAQLCMIGARLYVEEHEHRPYMVCRCEPAAVDAGVSVDDAGGGGRRGWR